MTTGLRIPERLLSLPRDKRGYPVPYVAMWESEIASVLPPPCDPRFGEIVVSHGAQGQGVPILGQMEPSRQRECMLEQRCQVCHRSLAGKLRFMAGGPTLLWFSEPNVCVTCMGFALRVCPGLLAGIRHHVPAHRLVVHRVHEVELCQERVGYPPPDVPVLWRDPVTTQHVMIPGGEAFCMPLDFKPDRQRESLLYFIRARVLKSDTYTAAEFHEEFGA